MGYLAPSKVESKDPIPCFLGARRLHLLVAALLVLGALLASPAAGAEPAKVTISLLTMGAGDSVFSKFGHDALVVSESGRTAYVYNFGTFSFQSKTLFRDFLKGRLRYWLSVSSLGSTVAEYRDQNRSLVAQELVLPSDTARRVARALAENALPANRYYLYDHFRDNCATRVRDVLDDATQGALRRTLTRPATESYRDHALRLVADDWLLYLGLDLGLGPLVDRPVTEWDEAFLPERLAAGLRRVRVPGPSGEIPLVARESTLYAAERPPSRREAPTRAPWLALLGSTVGGVLAWLPRRSTRARRWATGTLLAALGLVGGLLGALLAFLWAMTNNEVAHQNANALLCPLVALALVPAGVGLARGRQWGARLAEWTLLACCLTAGGAIALALALHQDVTRTASLLAPIWLGGWLGTRAVRTRSGP